MPGGNGNPAVIFFICASVSRSSFDFASLIAAAIKS